jgi:hypothetical protein
MDMLRVESQDSDIKQSIWDSAAIQINKTIDSIEKSPYYVKKEYWGQHQPSKLEVF